MGGWAPLLDRSITPFRVCRLTAITVGGPLSLGLLVGLAFRCPLDIKPPQGDECVQIIAIEHPLVSDFESVQLFAIDQAIHR